MSRTVTRSSAARAATWVFFGAFLFACLVFWWLPSILFALLGLDDPVEGWALWVSLLGAAMFAGGYFLVPLRFRPGYSTHLLDVCEAFAYKATLWLALPAILLALQFFFYRSGVEYGDGEGLSLLQQAVFYGHMFFAFLFLGTAKTISQDRRRIVIVSALVIAPRLIISLHWGRFFLVQAVVPVLLIALARGWVALSAKRILQFSALALFVVFVPALTRGDNFLGQDELVRFFQAGSTLVLFQENRDLDLAGRCPPLLVSMTDKVIPYSLLKECTMEFKGYSRRTSHAGSDPD